MELKMDSSPVKNGQLKYRNFDNIYDIIPRVLYSTLDIDTTFYLQVILGLEKNLPVGHFSIDSNRSYMIIEEDNLTQKSNIYI